MNLKTQYGSKYRVTLDESYKHETEDGKTKNERWYHEIKGRYGYVYPYSDVQLAVCFTSNIIANKFNGRGWKILQNGENERTVLIPNQAIEEVLEAIKPRKRRILTELQKNRLLELSKPFLFKKRTV